MSIHVSYVTYIHTQFPTYTHVLVFIKGGVPLNIVCGGCVGQNLRCPTQTSPLRMVEVMAEVMAELMEAGGGGGDSTRRLSSHSRVADWLALYLAHVWHRWIG